jgi:release factor glutamine methyltransferase
MPTLAQAITEGARRLRASSVDEERRTAGILLCHVLQIDRTHLLTKSEEEIDEPSYHRYLELVERRAAGEPLQYITGHQEFYGLDFIVTPEVLIPRPETEFLVERVVEIAKEFSEEPLLIAEAGTGSGCVAVAVAVHLPRARVIATDISQAAIEVARRNAERHGVIDRIEFLEGDLFAPLAELRLEGAVDVLASNPPYVNEETFELLQREVRDWEPREALFGGVDGLDFYRRLIAESPHYLKPGGYVVLEIGFSQVDSISEMVKGNALELVDITPDLQGIPRTLCLRRTA